MLVWLNIESFLYFEVSQIVHHRHTRHYRRQHSAVLGLLAIIVVRLVRVVALMQCPAHQSERECLGPWPIDPVPTYLRANALDYDPLYIGSIILFCVYTFEVKRSLYFGTVPDRWVWQEAGDLVVRATEAYRHSLRPVAEVRQLCTRLVRRHQRHRTHDHYCGNVADTLWLWITTVRVRLFVWRNLYHVRLDRFRQCRYRFFAHLSDRSRVKLLRMLLVCEKLNYWSFSVIFSVQLLLSFLYMRTFTERYPVWQWPILLVDTVVYQSTLLSLLQITLLLFYLSFLVNTANREYLRELNADLQTAVDRHRAADRNPGSSTLQQSARQQVLHGKLHTFLTQHTQFCGRIPYVNRKMWGYILFVSLLTNLPVNVNYWYRVCYLTLSRTELIFTWVILVMQFLFLSVSLNPLAQVSLAIHRPAVVCLPTALLCLSTRPGSITCFRVKWMNQLERLTTRDRHYGQTIGRTERTVNYPTIWEILLSYVVYLLFVFGSLNRTNSLRER